MATRGTANLESAPPVSALEAHLGYWLRLVSNHVSQGFARKVEAAGVTVAEWVLLREMYRQGAAAPSALAEALAMTRGTVSKLIDRLEAKLLARRAAGAADRRYQVVSLTAAGKKLVPQLAALADRNDAEFFGHLGADQHAQLLRLLKDLVRVHQFKDVPVD